MYFEVLEDYGGGVCIVPLIYVVMIMGGSTSHSIWDSSGMSMAYLSSLYFVASMVLKNPLCILLVGIIRAVSLDTSWYPFDYQSSSSCHIPLPVIHLPAYRLHVFVLQ